MACVLKITALHFVVRLTDAPLGVGRKSLVVCAAAQGGARSTSSLSSDQVSILP